MQHTPFNDRRARKLLARVGDDLTHLRQDVAALITHAAHRTVPDGTRQLAENARHQLESGGAYAAARLRTLRTSPPKEALGVAGGLVLAGLIAYGVYAFCKNRCPYSTNEEENEY